MKMVLALSLLLSANAYAIDDLGGAPPSHLELEKHLVGVGNCVDSSGFKLAGEYDTADLTLQFQAIKLQASDKGVDPSTLKPRVSTYSVTNRLKSVDNKSAMQVCQYYAAMLTATIAKTR